MTANATAAKRHHYVPQSYLRGFATDKERIRAVPLDSARRPFVSAVKNVAAENHFHRVDGLEDPGEVETVLSRIEGAALRIMGDIVEGRFPVPEDDRWVLAYYIALQAVRGPSTRRTIEHLYAHAARVEVGVGGRAGVAGWVQRNFGVDVTEEEADRIWSETTRTEGPPVTLSNVVHIRHMLNTAEKITSAVAARPWLVVRFDRRSLVTSDSPVTLIRNYRDQPWRGVGFQTAWGICFPLTRKVGLLMTDPMPALQDLAPTDPRVQDIRARVLNGDGDREEFGTTIYEKLFNRYTAQQASQYLFHHPDDTAFVPEELPEPTLITVDASAFQNMAFDGEPWFASSRGTTTEQSETNCADS